MSFYNWCSRLFTNLQYLRGKRWTVLRDLIKKNDYKSFVEVGVWEGVTSSYVLRHCPGLERVYCVDDYCNPDDLAYDVESYALAREKALNRLKDKKVVWLLKSSVEASKEFSDGSLDLVFIDANHTYKDLMEDIGVWLPKVRVGGMICGHDYSLRFIGVVKAVSESFDYYGLYEDSVWAYKKNK